MGKPPSIAYDLVSRHEGLRLQAYLDTRGNLTVGRGRNLQNPGISVAEADLLFSNDIDRVTGFLQEYDWYERLTDSRKAALIDMVFALGESGFQEFRQLISDLSVGAYTKAADEMLNSKWATQVPERAQEDAELMRRGWRWP